MKKILSVALGIATFIYIGQAVASIAAAETGIVYPAGPKEHAVKYKDNSGSTFPVQTRIVFGDLKASPTNATASFVKTTPASRVVRNNGQSQQSIFTGASLPLNKEGVFWLDILEISPDNDAPPGENKLHMAFRTRLNLFYRPADRSGKPADAPVQFKWSARPTLADVGNSLQALNSSAIAWHGQA